MSGTHCCDPKIISIKAIAETKGKFVIGQSGSLIIKITDSQGNPANPSSIEFSIRDSNNNVVIVKDIDGTTLTGESLRPDKVADGFFVYEWRLDDSLNADDYTITWSYIVDGTEYNVVDTVTVSNDGVYTELYNDKMVALRESLDYLLCCMQNVPIYNEQAKPSQDCKTYYFTRSNWKQNPAQTRIYRNGHTIIASGITIDYTNGKVIFDKKN